MEKSKFLDIKISDGDYGDFFPLSVNLIEGISEPYKAVITVLTVKSRTLNEVREILGKQVSLTIRQYINNGKTCSRFLSGIISGYKNKGVIYSKAVSASLGSGRATCVCYEFTVEPAISAATYGKKSRTFRNQTIIDVIKAIGNEYGTEFINALESFDERLSSKNTVYHQSNESDLAFIGRLLVSYGLNYYFINDKDSFEPKVYLTDRDTFKPFSTVYYNDTEKDSASVQECILAHVGQPENIISLSNFEVTEHANHKEFSESRLSSYGYEYNKSYGDGEEIIDKSLIRSSLKTYFKNIGSYWSGSGGHCSLMAGAKLSVSGFSTDDNDKLSCLIARSSLYCKSPWPVSMALPDYKGFDEKEKSLIQFFDGVIIEDTGEPVYSCGTIGDLCLPVKDSSNTGDIILKGTVSPSTDFFNNSNNSSDLIVAFVCDLNGVVNSSDNVLQIAGESNENVPTMFYALPESDLELDSTVKKDKVITVNFVAPIGGKVGRIHYFPHIGDKILLGYIANKYYLLGYLSTYSDITGIGENLKEYLTNRTVFRRETALSNGNIQAHELSMSDVSSLSDNISNCIMDKTIDGFIEYYIDGDANKRTAYESTPITISGKSYSSLKLACKESKAYTDACSKYASTSNSDKNAAKTAMDNAKSDLQKADNELLNNYNSVLEATNSIISSLKISSESSSSMKLKTDGNLNLSSLGNTAVSTGEDYSIVSNGDITIKASKEGNGGIEIVSYKSISLKSGSSSITINPNGITLMSRKWAAGTGPFDAAIYMDSISGVNIAGAATSLTSLYSTTIADALGGVVSARGGSLSLRGNTISLDTNNGINALVNLGVAITDSALQCITIYKEAKDGCEYTKYGVDEIKNIYNNVLGCIGVANKANKSNNKAWIWASGLITEALKFIADVIDMTVLVLITNKSEFLDKPCHEGSNVTGRDSLRLASMSAKLATTLLGMTGLIGKMAWTHASSIGIDKNIRIDSAKSEKVTINSQEFISPGAGIPQVVEEQQPQQPQQQEQQQEQQVQQPQQQQAQQVQQQEPQPQQQQPAQQQPAAPQQQPAQQPAAAPQQPPAPAPQQPAQPQQQQVQQQPAAPQQPAQPQQQQAQQSQQREGIDGDVDDTVIIDDL